MRYVASVVGFVALVLSCAELAAQPPANVVIARAQQESIGSTQMFVGTVNPSQHAVIGSAVSGRVIEVPRLEGERVAQGEPLAQLLTDTISLDLKAAEAELEIRRQELAELDNGSRPEEIKQARARMEGAEATKNYQLARRERAKRLFETGRAASQEELDEAVSAAIAAEQAYLEAKLAFDLVTQGPRKEKIAQATAQFARQQALVDQLKDQIKKHTIVSRFDGYVVAEQTEVGQWVQQGDPVAEVVALDEVDVIVHVVEKHIPFVRIGESAAVEIPAFEEKTFEGRVAFIVPQADPRSRTFPVKVRVKNEILESGPLLKSGMYARVQLPIGRRQDAIVVPKDAIVLGQNQHRVFVMESDEAAPKSGQVRPVPVTLGAAQGDSIQVVGPIRPQEWVIVQGNERLRPGQTVTVVGQIESPPQPSGSAEQATPPTS